MLIRHADPDRDCAACAAIYAPFVSDSVISLEEQPPDADEMARRIMTNSVRYPWLVADLDRTVVGYAYGSRHRERAAYRWAADVTVYVADGHRRQGVASQLYRTLLAQLSRQGLRMACAGITLPNQASVALHEACGFRPVGIYHRIAFKRGRWWDVGWWQAELMDAAGDPPPDPVSPLSLTRAS